MKNTMIFRLAAALALTTATAALADNAGQQVAKPTKRSNAAGFYAPFPFQGGEAIYKGVCQGCHMPDAKGAVGAGAYPALAKNEKLETAGYPVAMVLKGQKAMPGFGPQLDDRQVADVVNYIRSHFGNHYSDAVKPEDVKVQRE
jgi:mono/diheme cytochrome c family protein